MDIKNIAKIAIIIFDAVFSLISWDLEVYRGKISEDTLAIYMGLMLIAIAVIVK